LPGVYTGAQKNGQISLASAAGSGSWGFHWYYGKEVFFHFHAWRLMGMREKGHFVLQINNEQPVICVKRNIFGATAFILPFCQSIRSWDDGAKLAQHLCMCMKNGRNSGWTG